MSAGAFVDVKGVGRAVRERLSDADTAGRLRSLGAPERRLAVRATALEVLREHRAILGSASLTELVNHISDDVVGYGPVERLLRDPEVTEVMVNGADDVYVDIKVHSYRSDVNLNGSHLAPEDHIMPCVPGALSR